MIDRWFLSGLTPEAVKFYGLADGPFSPRVEKEVASESDMGSCCVLCDGGALGGANLCLDCIQAE